MTTERKLTAGLTAGNTREEYEAYEAALLHDVKNDEHFSAITAWDNFMLVLAKVDFSDVNDAFRGRPFYEDNNFNLSLLRRHLAITPEDGQSEAVKKYRIASNPDYRRISFESVEMTYVNIVRNLGYSYFSLEEKLESFPVQPIAGTLATVIRESEALQTYGSPMFLELMEAIHDVDNEWLIGNAPARSFW